MLSKYLNDKTIELATGSAEVNISYQQGLSGARTMNILIDPKGINVSMLDLVKLAGGKWLAEQIKARFLGGIVESFSDALGRALESIAFDDQGIAIGKLASLACTAINITYENQGEGNSRICFQFLTEEDTRSIFLNIVEVNDVLDEVTFSGELKLFKLKTSLVALYNPTEDWEVQLKTQPGEVVELSRLLTKFLQAISLPTELPEFSLTDVSLAWQPKNKAAYLATKIEHDWEVDLLGKPFSIKDNALQVTMAKEGLQQFNLEGVLGFGDTDALVRAAFKAGTGWDFLIQTEPGQTINLMAFTQALPQGFPDITDTSQPTLSNLLMAYNTGSKAYRFKFDLSDISFGQFRIEQLHVDLKTHQKTLKGAFTLMSGTKDEISIDVLAEKMTSDTYSGCLLIGKTGVGQEVPLGILVADLAGKFGLNTSVPKPLESLTLKNLDVSINTATKDFHFSGEANFEINNTAVSIQSQIDVSHRPHGISKKTFSGQLTLGTTTPKTFDLFFDKSESSTRILAAYHSPLGDRVSIADLLSSMTGIAIPDVLSFTLHDAVLAYDANKDSKKALFAAHLGSGVDLSDLPLVGKLIPKNQRLTFNYKVIVASEAVEVDEITIINSLLPETMSDLEEKPVNGGVIIAATLKMGDKTIPLDLPLSLNDVSVTQTTTVQGTSENDSEVEPSEPVPSIDSEALPLKVTSEDDPVKWISLNKTLGPVGFNRVGLNFQDNALQCLLDVSFTMGPLNLTLDGLSVATPIDSFKPTFHLNGLGLSYDKKPVEVSGAFLQDPKNNTYSGTAVIKTSKLNIAALGAYQELNGEPSLFVYALLDMPVGVGPAFLQVTGISAGFGYNRTIKVPDLAGVKNFPLVSAVMNKGGSQETNPLKLLDKIKMDIPAAKGELFMAFGVKFNSFKILDSFALLLLRMGRNTRLDVLGLSRMKIPSQATKPLVNVELAIKASYDFEEKVLKVRGVLTRESYLFSPQCRLSGGFAFYSWFEGTHAGDMVLTMGGYHPDFKVPDHYPQVPRLAFYWQLTPQLNIKGSMYYALTPGALMVGGRLEAIFEAEKSVSFDLELLGVKLAGVKLYGKIRAWLIIGADFLMAWEPYHYDARVYLNVGISVIFRGEVYVNLFFTTVRKSAEKRFDINLGANLHIWGPEFAGIAHVDWSIISFDIAFGKREKPKVECLQWDTFRKAFLPEKDEAICTIAIADGIISEEDKDKKKTHIVNAAELVLSTHSVIPSITSNVVYEKEKQKDKEGEEIPEKTFGIGSMGITTVNSSKQIITILDTDDADRDITDKFTFTPIRQNVSGALWGDKMQPGLNDDQLVTDLLTGFQITPAPKQKPAHTENKLVSDFAYDVELGSKNFTWESSMNLKTSTFGEEERRKIITDGTVCQARNELLESLRLDTGQVDLSGLDRETDNAFLVAPQVVSINQ